jgi:nucleotide-binding universal stress UspA family protein
LPSEHILLCYLGSGDSDDVLRQAAELSRASGARLSVLLPVVETAVPDGCCGVQGEHWRRLMDEATRDAARHAERVLTALACAPANVAVDVGHSISEIALAAAERLSTDAIAVGRKRYPWSGGLSRRQLNQLRRAAPGRIVEFEPRRGGDVRNELGGVEAAR